MNSTKKHSDSSLRAPSAPTFRPRLRSAVRAGEMGAVSQAVSAYGGAPAPACYHSSNWGSDYANERY